MSISSFLLINKPSGPTSHDIVDELRHLTGEKTIGHAGTLDPFATGLLIMGIGREATRRMLALTHLDKWYEAEIELGVETDTYDRTGTVVHETCNMKHVTQDVFNVLKNFLGPQEQVPPMFSAKKINGKKLYELARAGKEVKRPTAKVSIYRLEMLHAPCSMLHVLIRCSSGTYIRSLAHDFGQKLGCGAHLKELRRLAIGPFGLAQASTIEQLRLQTDNWQERVLPIPQVLEILNDYKQNPVNVIASPDATSGRGDLRGMLRYARNDKNYLPANGYQLTAKKVLCFGTFDPLHEGHHYFLTEAKKYGDHLIVIVTRDEHVKHFKNREPCQNETERLAAVRALSCVDEVCLSDEKLDWKCLEEAKPDIIVLGHDQNELKAALQKHTAIPLIQLREMVI